SNHIDYNEDKIEESKKQKKSFNKFFHEANSWPLLKTRNKVGSTVEDKDKIDKICAKFKHAMDDDFNTSIALACLFELIDLGLGFVSSDKEDMINYAKLQLEDFSNIFGLTVKAIIITKEAKEMLEERDRARKDKDFKRADAIREEIKKKFNLYIADTGSTSAVSLIPPEE
ncbi:MAG: hypothetical protein KKH80_02150, partial [Candidatus Omnitrophica bacterium]|nr:hypothetical protein [Candidatus Omnitrophota bacterium]